MISTARDLGDVQLEAVIDLDAIAENCRAVAEYAGDARVMAVVKADGYGHGAAAVVPTMLANGVDRLGVTTIGEALELRRSGVTAPILAWMLGVDADYGAAIRADVAVGVSSPRHLAAVVAAAREAGRTATVTPKIDTGLNRNGISATEWPDTLRALAAAEAEGAIHVDGLFAHFAHADEPNHPVIDAQAEALSAAIADARRAGLRPEINHHANSAATLTRPDLRFDMVRPGIALYGHTPVPGIAGDELRPAMTLRAKVLIVKDVAAGAGVSYGHTWHAPRDTRVAVIPAGYADGVPRALSNRFEVAIGGRRFPNIGRVCMDQFVVDLGPDGGGVREGDEAVLFGDASVGAPTAQDWARTLDTIDYEIITGVRGRAVRRYRGGA